MMEDIRIEMKFRNNIILQKMEDMGIKTVAELAREIGHPSRQAAIGAIINMTTSPLLKEDEKKLADGLSLSSLKWKSMVRRLALFFKCLPEDLFSPEQLERGGLETNKAHMAIASSDVHLLVAGFERLALSPGELMNEIERDEVIAKVLSTLPSRSEDILRRRFGMDPYSESQGLEEVARAHEIKPERVRQIEGSALVKLRKPLRAKHLRPFS